MIQQQNEIIQNHYQTQIQDQDTYLRYEYRTRTITSQGPSDGPSDRYRPMRVRGPEHREGSESGSSTMTARTSSGRRDVCDQSLKRSIARSAPVAPQGHGSDGIQDAIPMSGQVTTRTRRCPCSSSERCTRTTGGSGEGQLPMSPTPTRPPEHSPSSPTPLTKSEKGSEAEQTDPTG
jgi:hypothetical protein